MQLVSQASRRCDRASDDFLRAVFPVTFKAIGSQTIVLSAFAEAISEVADHNLRPTIDNDSILSVIGNACRKNWRGAVVKKIDDPSRCVDALRRLGFRDVPFSGVSRKRIEMISPEGNVSLIQIHMRSRGGVRNWFGINAECLTTVDFVVLWIESSNWIAIIPSPVLNETFGRMNNSHNLQGVGGPKVENGQWHVNVNFCGGGTVSLHPVNWILGEVPTISKWCQLLPKENSVSLKDGMGRNEL